MCNEISVDNITQECRRTISEQCKMNRWAGRNQRVQQKDMVDNTTCKNVHGGTPGDTLKETLCMYPDLNKLGLQGYMN